MRRSIIFLIFATFVALGGAAQAQGTSDAPRARTHDGEVSGVRFEGIDAYKGIPYAAPPVGALRWAPPAAPAPWSGVRASDDYGASCSQPEEPRFIAPGSKAETTSEDCLTLNVWTPVARSGALPVMVWIHGGANVSGTGSQTYYDGSAFARDGIVLVSFNYRLGALGFFAPPGGGPDMNFGLLDQMAALRWVQANIAAFGGDPANVTAFGESAGGEDILLLERSPAARGLFKRAIAESAASPWSRMPDPDEARKQSAALLARIGAGSASLDAARAIPATSLVANESFDELPGPVVDGASVLAQLWVRSGLSVPTIIGTNRGDGSVLGEIANPEKLFPSLTATDLATLRALYAPADDAAFGRDLFTDGYFAVPARWIAATATPALPVYRYRFDYIYAALRARRTVANHGSEIPFVFQTLSSTRSSAEDRIVMGAMHDCWAAFARTGTPSCSQAPDWKPESGDGKEMIFDAAPSFRDAGEATAYAIFTRDVLPDLGKVPLH